MLLFRIIFNDNHQEQKYIEINYELQQPHTLNLSEVLKDFANREVIPLKSQLFYLDTVTNHFVYADFLKSEIRLKMDSFRQNLGEQKIKENEPHFTITILIKNVSDEILANPKKPSKKRSKQRVIEDVVRCCKEWRRLYRDVQPYTQKKPMNLEQSALLVGVARKTLEDYFLQLKNAKKLGFNFGKFKHSKMGVLRNFVKQNSVHLNLSQGKSKLKSQHDEQQQTQFFHSIQSQMHVIKVIEAEVEEIDVGQYLHFNGCDQSRSDHSSESES